MVDPTGDITDDESDGDESDWQDDGSGWHEVTLVPVSGGPPAHGEVVHAATHDGVAIRVALGVARSLDGERVWATARNRHGALRVMRAAASRSAARRDEVVLHDVVQIAGETRRSRLRAAVEHSVLLVQDGTRTRRTVTVDLSSGGCRVRRLPEHHFAPGQRLRAALAVDSGPAVWAETEVVRVDEAAGEIALRFLTVADADRDRLDRDVLAYLTGQAQD